MTTADLLGPMLSGFAGAFRPMLGVLLSNAWWIVPSLVLGLVVRAPMPGRGPSSTERDHWRGYKHGVRREVLERAQHRCEASAFVIWGRCADAATEVDHVYAWCKGGPTTAANGQALCSGHNRSKGAWSVPWWYLRALEERRRSYFLEGADVRVHAAISAEERASHAPRSVRTATSTATRSR